MALLAAVGMACLLTHNRTTRWLVVFAAFAASAHLLFDPYAFLAVVASFGFLIALWRTCPAPRDLWTPWGTSLLYFITVWLVFFATGNEFDLTAANALRKGMIGSDTGGAEGFSLEWTISLVLLKLILIHLLPLIALAYVVSRQSIVFDWIGFLLMGAMLHFALFLGFFVRYATVGFSATGGILVSAVSCLVFAAACPVLRLATPCAAKDVGQAARPVLPPVSSR